MLDVSSWGGLLAPDRTIRLSPNPRQHADASSVAFLPLRVLAPPRGEVGGQWLTRYHGGDILKEYPRLLSDGGGSLPVQRPGCARWSARGVGLGLAVSALLHLLLYAVVVCLPWEVSIRAQPDAPTEILPWPPVALVTGPVTTTILVLLAALALATWILERPRGDRMNVWALVSAFFNAAAMLVGIAVAGWEGLLSMNVGPQDGVPFGGVLLYFGLALAAGAMAVGCFLLRRGGSRGWVLAAWGIVMPLWFGGQLCYQLELPPFRPTSPVERLDELPAADHAIREGRYPDRTIVRPILHVLADGTVQYKERVLLDPAREETDELEKFLLSMSRMMRHAPIDQGGSGGPLFPDDSVLLLPEATVEFTHVVRILRSCAKRDIGLWKVQLGVRLRDPRWLGYYRVLLPITGPPSAAEAPAAPLLRLEVVAPGTKLEVNHDSPWSGNGRFRFGSDRIVRYSFGEHTTEDPTALAEVHDFAQGEVLLSDCGPGVVWGDVARALDALAVENGATIRGHFPLR